MSARWSSSSGRPIDDEPDVVGPRIQAEPPEPLGVQCPSAASSPDLPVPDHGRMFVEFHHANHPLNADPIQQKTKLYIQPKTRSYSPHRLKRFTQDAGFPNPSREAICSEGCFPVLADQAAWPLPGLSPRTGWILSRSFAPWDVSRIVWFRPPVGGSDSSQPFCFMSSTSRLRVDFSIRKIRETSAGRALAQMGDGRQDVCLADPEPERSQGFVVQGRDHPIDQPDPDSDALRAPSDQPFRISTIVAS